MEPNSALASLTANYTDSEPEELTDDESSSNAVVITSTAPSASNSPSSRESHPGQVLLIKEDDPAVLLGVKSEKKPQGEKKSRLVSYQDDLIDDDVVDDYEASDGRDIDNSDDNSDSNQSDIDEERENKMDIDEEANTGGDGEDDDSSSKKRIKIPPEPPGKCSVELQEKIKSLFERKQRSGFDMNEYIQRNKSFRNPSIYEKLIKYCDLDELGTNYPPDKYDPHEWKPSSFYDELAKTQKVEMEKREKERKDRTKVEFVSGTVRKPTSGNNSTSNSSQGEAEKRKSKWDQRGVMPPLLSVSAPGPGPVQQQGQIPPPTLLSASGTKSTVINAFGNPMHKKSKP